MNAVAQVAALSAHSPTSAQPRSRCSSLPALRPDGFLHVHVENVDDVRMWAFVVGFRNLLAGMGTIIGLVILHSATRRSAGPSC